VTMTQLKEGDEGPHHGKAVQGRGQGLMGRGEYARTDGSMAGGPLR